MNKLICISIIVALQLTSAAYAVRYDLPGEATPVDEHGQIHNTDSKVPDKPTAKKKHDKVAPECGPDGECYGSSECGEIERQNGDDDDPVGEVCHMIKCVDDVKGDRAYCSGFVTEYDPETGIMTCSPCR